MVTKVCSKCHKELELNDYNFRRRKDSKDGFRNTCRLCDGHKYIPEKPKAKDGYKICNKCNKELLKNTDYFRKDPTTKDGFTRSCKECLGSEYTNKLKAKDGYKICSKCGKELPNTTKYFNIKRKNPIRLDARCKSCQSKYSKHYWQNNTEKHKLDSRKSYLNNKEKVLTRSAVRYKTNKDDINSHRREFYQEHKDEYSERHKKYDKSDEGKIAAFKKRIKRNNSLSKVIIDFKPKQWKQCKEFFNNSCAYCGKKLDRLQHDHVIPIAKGGKHISQNIVTACIHCNSSKTDKNMEEWYKQQSFYSQERLNKIYEWINLNKKLYEKHS